VITTPENISTIAICNILGNEVVVINPNGSTCATIAPGNQRSGVYFVKILANQIQTVKCVIINN
jgi:hypothetical protein